MKKFYIVFILMIPLLLFSQGENDNWYFGDKAALNFSNNTPVSLNNSNMYALEACGTVSNKFGELLFYMSGEKIWNREHQVMPNGSLLPNDSSQQLTIVKNPLNSNQYYVFTTGENNASSVYRISYSIVDMSLGNVGNDGNPLGDVIQGAKEIAVLDNLGNEFYSEAITVIPHSDTSSYWILIPNGTKLYSYKLDFQGFHNSDPVISNLNFPINLNTYKYYGIKESPMINNESYSHYICLSFWFNTEYPNLGEDSFTNKIYSFNSSTGKITNDFSLQIDGLRAYAPEFNKDASVLFLGYQNIYAVDLVNSTPTNVQHIELYHGEPASTNGIGIQRNKYGDIYLSKTQKTFLGKIINPNVFGPNMSVNLNAVSLISGKTAFGLPRLVYVQGQANNYFPCMENLLLTTEPNTFSYYSVGKIITAKDTYIVNPNKNITMQAGLSINLLPGTFIENGAQYFGFIDECEISNFTSQKQIKSKPVEMFLKLDKNERKVGAGDIKIYPNPTSDILNFDSSEKITQIEVYDISGRKANVTIKANKADVRNLPAGSYMINIKTEKGSVTKQFIKK